MSKVFPIRVKEKKLVNYPRMQYRKLPGFALENVLDKLTSLQEVALNG